MGMIEFAKNMKKYFGISNSNKFIDPLMSTISKKPTIDILAFDDWLHEKHGEYEEDGHSMETILVKEYGVQASAFINSVI